MYKSYNFAIFYEALIPAVVGTVFIFLKEVAHPGILLWVEYRRGQFWDPCYFYYK